MSVLIIVKQLWPSHDVQSQGRQSEAERMG